MNRKAKLTSDWLSNYIREHGAVMTVTRELIVD